MSPTSTPLRSTRPSVKSRTLTWSRRRRRLEIREHLPNVKMIACLRDPVQRTFSDYLDRVKNGKMDGTFEEELERDPALINRSRYGTQLARYLELFDRAQFHIVSFDELVATPARFRGGHVRVSRSRCPAPSG